MSDFTHIDSNGRVRMVDVSGKKPTFRKAIASGKISMKYSTFEKITIQKIKKGNVLETARIAGIMSAKKTSELIPMCHPLDISHVQLDFFSEHIGYKTGIIRIEASVSIIGKTGVEMEALTSVSIAALTIYDMCKAYDKEMIISDICLLKKTGGKSKTYERISVP